MTYEHIIALRPLKAGNGNDRAKCAARSRRFLRGPFLQTAEHVGLLHITAPLRFFGGRTTRPFACSDSMRSGRCSQAVGLWCTRLYTSGYTLGVCRYTRVRTRVRTRALIRVRTRVRTT